MKQSGIFGCPIVLQEYFGVYVLFHTEEEITREIFNLINDQLYKQEKKEYPFHYVILENKKELYENYLITFSHNLYYFFY